MTLYKIHHDAFFARYKNEKENPNYPVLMRLREKIYDVATELDARKKECTTKKLAIAKAAYDRLLHGNGVEPLQRHLDMLQSQFIKIAVTMRPPAPEKVISPPSKHKLRALRTNPLPTQPSVARLRGGAHAAISLRRKPARGRK